MKIATFILSLGILYITADRVPEKSLIKTMATCTGSKECKACKNCKYCKHCAKNGKTCGVCK